jgi:flagellar biosynthesis protein
MPIMTEQRSPGHMPGSTLPVADRAPADFFDARQQAVALAYDAERGPPRVVAKGRGAIAAAILERARTHGVYVHESRELLSLLMQIDLDRHIPAPLYRAVAELLAWLHQIDAGLLDSESRPPRLTLQEHDAT